jgi:hypothetical protein
MQPPFSKSGQSVSWQGSDPVRGEGTNKTMNTPESPDAPLSPVHNLDPLRLEAEAPYWQIIMISPDRYLQKCKVTTEAIAVEGLLERCVHLLYKSLTEARCSKKS